MRNRTKFTRLEEEMNNKKDIFKILLPILAVVIVVESVVVVSRLSKKDSSMPDLSQIDYQASDTEEDLGPVKATVGLTTDSANFKVGEKYTVTMSVTPLEDMKLDAIDVLVSYDTKKAVVTSLTEEDGFKATSKLVSDKTGSVVANFWSMDAAGYALTGGQATKLLSFSVEPLVAGDIELKIVKKSETGGTKLVSTVGEDVTVNNFDIQDLMIKATN